MKLTKEELTQAKELANEIKNQDPDGKKWGTRPPLIFLLQDIEERFDPVNGGDFKVYASDDGEAYRGESEEEILKEIMEGTDADDFADEEEFQKHKDDLLSDIQCESYDMVHEYVTKYTFLTEKAAKRHLEQNKHHYSKKARIYVDHAWRNPQMELALKIILLVLDE
tara:strand:- start:1006 stop:1506 length:501 start_codon:yes stop_codon:yes gene_type:complete